MSQTNYRMRITFTVIGISIATGFTPAWAHLEPKPNVVLAGRKVIVSFLAEHGCGNSPTVGLAIKPPNGLDATPVPKAGWKTSVSKGVVAFSGGQISAHKTGTFSLSFMAPSKAGTSLVFPSVQTCLKGEKVWLQPTIKGQPEPNFPAPVIEVVATREAPNTMAKTTQTSTSVKRTAKPSATSA